jgi:polysaccharide deacetylase 2 family uncharacterized protein YibQ
MLENIDLLTKFIRHLFRVGRSNLYFIDQIIIGQSFGSGLIKPKGV